MAGNRDRSIPSTVRAADDETLAEAGWRSHAITPPSGIRPASRRVAGASDAAGAGEYVLEKLIGRGGMGDVYAARHLPTDRLVALKVARDHGTGGHSEYLLWEAQATAKLEHPGIVPVHDIGIVDGAGLSPPALDAGQPFYVMRILSDGRTWDHAVSRMPLRENIDILLRVADAVRYAHSQGVIHRDLKPANIMLGDFGEVFVMDWGLAAATGEVAASGVSAKPLVYGDMTSTGLSLGTPSYAAPELARGETNRIGAATDIYLLGAILFEILASVPPHGLGDAALSIRLAIENSIDWNIIPQEHCELAAVAEKALCYEPAERYRDVGEFQSALKEWLRHSEGMELFAKARNELSAAQNRAGAPGSGGAYAAFERARGFLDAAGELSPDNAAFAALRLDLDNANASFALSQGDLELAQARLPASGGNARTETLRADIDNARGKRKRRARRYKYFRASLGIAAGIVLLLLLFVFHEARQLEKTLWHLSDRLYANGIASRTLGHNREAENSFADAFRLFQQLGRDVTAPKLALREVRDPDAPSLVVPSALDPAISLDLPVQAWVFPEGGDMAVCLAAAGAAALDTGSGRRLWRWQAPDAIKGVWASSPSGRTALFIPALPAGKFFFLRLSDGKELDSGSIDPGLISALSRVAVADDASRWFLAGRTELDEDAAFIIERDGANWLAEPLRFAKHSDSALFLAPETLFLSSPQRRRLGGKHLIAEKRDGGWQTVKSFGKRPSNPIQSAFLARGRLIIAYSRPPAMPESNSPDPYADDEGKDDFVPGTIEEWTFEKPAAPQLSGRGRRYPDRLLAGLGRWLDIAYSGDGWPKTVLFNANAANGLVVLLRLSRESTPEILRLLTAPNYRHEYSHVYVVAGSISQNGDAFLLGMSDGSLLAFPSTATRDEWHLSTHLRIDNRRSEVGLAVSGDGSRILSVSSEGSFAVIDTKARQEIFSDSANPGVLRHENDDGNRSASLSLLEFVLLDPRISPPVPAALDRKGERAIFLWNSSIMGWTEGQSGAASLFPPCPQSPEALAFNDDGGIMAYSTDAVYAHNSGKWETLQQMPPPQGWEALVHPLVVSADGSRLLRVVVDPSPESLLGINRGIGDLRGAIEMWDIKAGKCLWRTEGIATALAMTGDKSLVTASLAGDKGCVLLHGTTGRAMGMLSDSTAVPIARLAFSPDGKFLAGTNVEHQVRVWSIGERLECIRRPFMPRGSALGAIAGHVNEALAFSPGGELVVLDANGMMQGDPASIRPGSEVERVRDSESAAIVVINLTDSVPGNDARR